MTPQVRGGNAFEAANEWMIAQAVEAGSSDVRALVVWDGQEADGGGGTADLAERAASAGIPVFGIDPSPRPSATRQWAPGPKKLLALDGGGIRGVLSLGILEQVESKLRHWAGRPDLVLADYFDYFDYIGGTSTGAIIASGLALGMPVAEVLELYRTMSSAVFKFSWLSPFASLHPAGPLRKQLDTTLGPAIRLGDPALKSLLLLVLHNVTPIRRGR